MIVTIRRGPAEIGRVIKRFRDRAGLSLEEFAKGILDGEVTRQAVFQWEKGQYVPDDRVLIRIARAYRDRYGEAAMESLASDIWSVVEV